MIVEIAKSILYLKRCDFDIWGNSCYIICNYDCVCMYVVKDKNKN